MKQIIEFLKRIFGQLWRKKEKPTIEIETDSLYRGTKAIRKQGNLTLWQMDPQTGIVQRAPVTENGLKADKSMVYIWSLNRRNAIRNLKAQGFKPAEGNLETKPTTYTANFLNQ